MAKILDKKTIPISSLPDGQIKAILESYVTNPSSSQVNVVLTLEMGQYVAYIGYPDAKELREERKNSSDALYNCQKIRTFDQVVRLGDRLSDDERITVFGGSR